jgi:hypothetical protein
VASKIGLHNYNSEENLYEYLQAEIIALRAKKDEFSSKVSHLTG